MQLRVSPSEVPAPILIRRAPSVRLRSSYGQANAIQRQHYLHIPTTFYNSPPEQHPHVTSDRFCDPQLPHEPAPPIPRPPLDSFTSIAKATAALFRMRSEHEHQQQQQHDATRYPGAPPHRHPGGSHDHATGFVTDEAPTGSRTVRSWPLPGCQYHRVMSRKSRNHARRSTPD